MTFIPSSANVVSIKKLRGRTLSSLPYRWLFSGERCLVWSLIIFYRASSAIPNQFRAWFPSVFLVQWNPRRLTQRRGTDSDDPRSLRLTNRAFVCFQCGANEALAQERRRKPCSLLPLETVDETRISQKLGSSKLI